MNRTDQRTNEFLARAVERFRFHFEKVKSENPIMASVAMKMCEVEMWTLTQE